MDYDDTDEMEDEYEYDQNQTDRFYGDDDYDDEWYDDYETDGFDWDAPVYVTWAERLRLLRIDIRSFIWHRRNQIDRWHRVLIKDPGAMFRRCKTCGKRGCVAGTEVCWNDTIPF